MKLIDPFVISEKKGQDKMKALRLVVALAIVTETIRVIAHGIAASWKMRVCA